MEVDKILVQKNIENLKQHIKKNHSNLTNVKVFGNNEDNSYIIQFACFKDYDLDLTLKINGDLKIHNSILTVNYRVKEKQADKKIKSLEINLANKIKELDSFNDKLLVKFFNKAYEYIDKNFDTYQSGELNSNVTKRTNKQSNSSPSREKVDRDVNIKKSSMKTAADVVNRIEWDKEINKEFISVGYLDRFLGLKECMFTTFDWGDIVLAELDALAIPEHRICYFKYKDEIIWDKRARLDNVFGSTGSNLTIYDEIKRLEKKEFVPINNENQANNQNQ